MVNIQNTKDNECYKWCIVRYLHPADHHSVGVRKIDEISADELDFEDINFQPKFKDIAKNKKKNTIGINVFGY